jgi:hypothetical protein
MMFAAVAVASPGTTTLVLPKKKAKGPRIKITRYRAPAILA